VCERERIEGKRETDRKREREREEKIERERQHQSWAVKTAPVVEIFSAITCRARRE